MASNRIFSKFKSALTPRRTTIEFSYYSFVALSWIPAVIFFNNHVAEVAAINGPSMYPYFNTSINEDVSRRDFGWVNKWAPRENLQRGMIVTFRSPSNPEVVSVKRVIALEGDTVYTRAPYPYPTAVVPKYHVWVEGDNKDGSMTLDSNSYGPISISLINGKLTHVVWPWSSFGPIAWWHFKGRTRVIAGRKQDAPTFD